MVEHKTRTLYMRARYEFESSLSLSLLLSLHYQCDMAKEGLVNNPQQMDDYCRDRGFVGWYETSAKENINVDEAAKCLVNYILEKEKAIEVC